MRDALITFLATLGALLILFGLVGVPLMVAPTGIHPPFLWALAWVEASVLAGCAMLLAALRLRDRR